MQKRYTILILKYKRLISSYWKVYRSDIHFVSYPKSGRTWLRMLLGSYLNKLFNLNIDNKKISLIQDFGYVTTIIPKFSMTHWNDPQLKRFSNVRLNTRFFNSKPLIFIIRDPFDVAKSYFYQFHFRGEKFQVINKNNYSSDIEEFIFGDYGGLKNIIAYHNKIKQITDTYKGKTLVIKYEDLKTDNIKSLNKLVSFLNIEFNEDTAKFSQSFSDKENLSNLEKRGLLNDFHFGGSGNGAKVRSESKELTKKMNVLRTKYIKMYAGKDPFYNL